jgi:hypothetical protein
MILAARVHENDTLIVIGSPRRSRVDRPRQHSNDAPKQFEPAVAMLVVDQRLDSHHVEVCGALQSLNLSRWCSASPCRRGWFSLLPLRCSAESIARLAEADRRGRHGL